MKTLVPYLRWTPLRLTTTPQPPATRRQRTQALWAADAPLNAMGVSWPDSWLNIAAYPSGETSQAVSSIQCTESVASNGKVPCSWYELARTYRDTTVVAPNVEAGVITGTATEAEALYQMLDNDLGAQIITWDSWTGVNGDYLRQVVIPLVNRHQGRLRNMACPFGAH